MSPCKAPAGWPGGSTLTKWTGFSPRAPRCRRPSTPIRIFALLEDELIFRPSWQIVGIEPELRYSGDYLTTVIAGTGFSVPVLILRDEELNLRAYVNVCRRQGHQLAAGGGNVDSLRCAYDGWVYGLDGGLRAVPGQPEGGLTSSSRQLGLAPLPLESWQGFIFVSVAPKTGLKEALGELPAVLEEEGYAFPFAAGNADDSFEYKQRRGGEPLRLQLEGAPREHRGVLPLPDDPHAQLLGAVQGRSRALRAPGVRPGCVPHDVVPGRVCRARLGLADRAEADYRFNWLWPNMFMGGGRRARLHSGWSRLVPAGVHNCIHVSTRFAMPGAEANSPSADLEAEYAEALRLTGEEDREVSARVQRGLRSGMYTYGYTLQESERNMRHVYKMVWDALSRPSGLDSIIRAERRWRAC